MLLTVINDSNVPITISEITIFYKASQPAGQGLSEIWSAGNLIWDDFEPGSPVTVSDFLADANLTISSNSSMALKIYFAKIIQHDGTELISISFAENGCDEHTTNP